MSSIILNTEQRLSNPRAGELIAGRLCSVPRGWLRGVGWGQEAVFLTGFRVMLQTTLSWCRVSSITLSTCLPSQDAGQSAQVAPHLPLLPGKKVLEALPSTFVSLCPPLLHVVIYESHGPCLPLAGITSWLLAGWRRPPSPPLIISERGLGSWRGMEP